MITSFDSVDFKKLANGRLRVGPFTVIVGANASGERNVRDTFRFLHGIGRSYSLAEIPGGWWGPGGSACEGTVTSTCWRDKEASTAALTGVEVSLANKRAAESMPIRLKCSDDFATLARRLDAIVRD